MRSVKLVAVMDLLAGRVVHARRGLRESYRPLESRLCPGGDAPALAAALRRLHPFHALYVADLDAILGRGDNFDVIAAVQAAVPRTELWVDAGIGDAAALRRFRGAFAATAVIGSETLAQLPLDDELVLSLDFKDGAFRGPPDLLAAPERWPRRVLAMNLDRVGSGEGPDLELLARLRACRPAGEIYAAGGIRNRADLEAVRAAGAAGALLASALYDGRLTAAELAACA